MRTRVVVELAVSVALSSALAVPGAQYFPEAVSAQHELSEGLGGFSGDLSPVDAFGFSVEALGDLDGDGVPDLAVGANLDDGNGFWKGAVWILFLDADGTVRSQQEINESAGGFGGVLGSGGRFGSGVASLGDLDGDGVGDLAVGAMLATVPGSTAGVVWLLSMNTDGTVRAETRLDGTLPALAGLPSAAGFGRSVEALGDLDGNGVPDVVAGAWKDGSGAAWILFLDAGGGIVATQRIAAGSGGFTGVPQGNFGVATACLGDLDGDGVVDLAVGANVADGLRGEVWILFLASDGTVRRHQRIAAGVGGFGGDVRPGDLFGTSLAPVPDRDGDGVPELAVGAVFDGDGALQAGAVWLLYLAPDGTVRSWQQISDREGGFGGGLTEYEHFGSGVAAIDTDGDGVPELAVGAANDNDFLNPPETGSVWLLELNAALWRDHGLGLAGELPAPVLRGGGALVDGTPYRLALTGVRPGALVFLVAGASRLALPFAGGTFFPYPDVVMPVVADGRGSVEAVGGVRGALPPGLEAYYQAWVVDPSGPAGFSASNGLSSRAP